MSNSFHNRFSPLACGSGRKDRKRKKRADSDASSGSPHPPASPESPDFQFPSKSEYQKLDIDGKMNCLFDMLSKTGPYFMKMDALNQNLYHSKAIYDVTEARLRLLEYKSLDMETRMLRKNLVFSGLAEEMSSDDCIPAIHRFLRDNLQIDPSDVSIVRATRIGRRRVSRGRTIPRAVLVTFADVRHVDTIMQNVRLLKNTPYGVSRDYPLEIREARKALWNDFKIARAEYGAKNVRLNFPAALVIHGETVSDAFPEWHKILKGSRNSDVKARTELRYKSIVEASLQAAHKSSDGLPPTDIAEESDESISGTDMDYDNSQDRHSSSQTQPAKTLTEPGYLLQRHPVMSSVSSVPDPPADNNDSSPPDPGNPEHVPSAEAATNSSV